MQIDFMVNVFLFYFFSVFSFMQIYSIFLLFSSETSVCCNFSGCFYFVTLLLVFSPKKDIIAGCPARAQNLEWWAVISQRFWQKEFSVKRQIPGIFKGGNTKDVCVYVLVFPPLHLKIF